MTRPRRAHPRVPLGDAPEPPITPDRRLCADHVKGVPILRCYPCNHCNISATASYDSSSDAKGQLTRTVSACYDVAAVTLTTPAGQ